MFQIPSGQTVCLAYFHLRVQTIVTVLPGWNLMIACVFQKNIRAGLMLKVKSVLKLNQRFFASSEYLGIGKKANSESNYSQTPLNMDTHIKWTVLF